MEQVNLRQTIASKIATMLSLLLLLLGRAEPTVDKDIVYSKPAGIELKMDVWQPAQSGKNRPAVIVIHGGGWSSGTKEQMTEMAKSFARNGFVAANVNYRLAPQSKWPAMIDDVQTAVRYMRANAAKYGVAKNRFGAAGASAGGHLSLFLGFTDTLNKKPTEFPGESSKVQAVCNFFGPTDLTTDFAPNAKLVLRGIFGDLKKASPMTYLDRGDAPVFTFHGDKDPLVPVNQAKILHEKLQELRIDNKIAIIEGGVHGIDIKNPEVTSALKRMMEWMKMMLGQ